MYIKQSLIALLKNASKWEVKEFEKVKEILSENLLQKDMFHKLLVCNKIYVNLKSLSNPCNGFKIFSNAK